MSVFGAFRNRKKTLCICKRLLARTFEALFLSSSCVLYLEVTKWTAVFIFQNREERVLTHFQAPFTNLSCFQVIYISISQWSLLTDTASSAIFHPYKPHSLISWIRHTRGVIFQLPELNFIWFPGAVSALNRSAWAEGFCGRLALHKVEFRPKMRDEVHQSSPSDSSGLRTFYITAVRFRCMWTG